MSNAARTRTAPPRRIALRPRRAWILALFAALSVPLAPTRADAVRIKELVQVRGVRKNPLVGYGLVVGLPGTGDTRRSQFTNQSLASLLRRMGVNVAPERLEVINTAAVMVTAELPPFGSPGDRMDVLVSAIGNARSLAGGTLLMTPLKGADGEIYAVAQGALTVGGFLVDGQSLARVQRNLPTSGRVPDGATVERAIPSRFVVEDKVTLQLNEADFTTAGRIVQAINKTVGSDVARAVSPSQVEVQVPDPDKAAPVGFLARLEAVDVIADGKARVVVNERTGTVVVGGKVTLSPAAIAHGNLSVSVTTRLGVSQPGAFASSGRTAVVPNVDLSVEEEQEKLRAVPATATVEELVAALNALGASPRDLIAILQALEAAGALNGALEVL
jgi:flagellar P-ring protein precursor FlgI